MNAEQLAEWLEGCSFVEDKEAAAMLRKQAEAINQLEREQLALAELLSAAVQKGKGLERENAELRTSLEAALKPGEAWLEAAIAWEVCASIHQRFAKVKDALYKTRHADFVNYAERARKNVAAPAQTPPPRLSDEEVEYPHPPAKPPVYATAANTKSVRDGFEMGGYEKEPGYYSEAQLDEFARAIETAVRAKFGVQE